VLERVGQPPTDLQDQEGDFLPGRDPPEARHREQAGDLSHAEMLLAQVTPTAKV
jgi:hypothetical protein